MVTSPVELVTVLANTSSPVESISLTLGFVPFPCAEAAIVAEYGAEVPLQEEIVVEYEAVIAVILLTAPRVLADPATSPSLTNICNGIFTFE